MTRPGGCKVAGVYKEDAKQKGRRKRSFKNQGHPKTTSSNQKSDQGGRGGARKRENYGTFVNCIASLEAPTEKGGSGPSITAFQRKTGEGGKRLRL